MVRRRNRSPGCRCLCRRCCMRGRRWRVSFLRSKKCARKGRRRRLRRAPRRLDARRVIIHARCYRRHEATPTRRRHGRLGEPHGRRLAGRCAATDAGVVEGTVPLLAIHGGCVGLTSAAGRLRLGRLARRGRRQRRPRPLPAVLVGAREECRRHVRLHIGLLLARRRAEKGVVRATARVHRRRAWPRYWLRCKEGRSRLRHVVCRVVSFRRGGMR